MRPTLLLTLLLALAVALVVAVRRKPSQCAREAFVMQDPVQDATLSRRGYDMAVVSTYCECAKRCAYDEACGAFAYAESGSDGLNACELASRTAVGMSGGTAAKPGSLLTYVADRCDVPDVA
jgi:hypothetical protein